MRRIEFEIGLPVGFTVRDLAFLMDALYDSAPDMDPDYVRWDVGSVETEPYAFTAEERDAFVESLKAHEWDVAPKVVVKSTFSKEVML